MTEDEDILYYAEVYGRGCTITTDEEDEFTRRHGTDNVRAFRYATEQDIFGVRSMGGYIPDGRIVK